MADSTVKYYIGNELFVYYDTSTGNSNTPLAYATECSISISTNTIDTSNKQSGVWASALPGQLSWTVSASALYTSSDNFNAIFNMYKTREKVKITFGEIQDLSTRDFDLNSSRPHYQGLAYITSMEINAGNNEVASFSIEFTGEGELSNS